MTTTTIDRKEQEALEAAATMLKAVAHPARIAMIELLDNAQRRSVTELFELLGMEQAVTSHHLALLRDKGVLRQEREGKHVYYSLKHPRLIEVVRCIRDCCTVEAR